MKPAIFFFLGGIVWVLVFWGWCGWIWQCGWCRVADARRRPHAAHSDLGDLAERKLDRCLAAEDRNQHLELLALGVDLGDGGRKGLERSLHDGDGLANLEVDDLCLARPGSSSGASCIASGVEGRVEHGVNLIVRQRNRLVGVTHEASDTGGVAHSAPALVGQIHADQDVSGHPYAGDQLALSALDLADSLLS